MTFLPWGAALTLGAIESFTLTILLLFVGKGLTQRYAWLRRYSIPDAVVGGVLCAAVVCLLYYGLGMRVSLSLDARNMMLLYFFAAIGLSTDVRTLREGGRPLVLLLVLSLVFMLLQNGLGMALATAFGMDPRAGLMAGSISLVGGVGTTLAWVPHFEKIGLDAAGELGLAANMVGMIAACLVGGPIAIWLMRRHRVKPSGKGDVEVGTRYKDEDHAKLDYHGVLLALLWLNVALILGRGITLLLSMAGLTLPAFVGCLLAGIGLRAGGLRFAPGEGRHLWSWPRMRVALALISDLCLGLFLTMALMGLQLWELQPVLSFLAVALPLQILLAVFYTAFVVFRVMGRNYEATVICAGFGGIALGSTATAIANMTAVTRAWGAAPRAFIVVPLVCGFFIDLVNAVVIGVLAR
jgi:ESS family glutamate:Na+ symporter